jgi:hypothetical protein
MPGLIDFLPTADGLIEVGPEDLGMILLQLLHQHKGSNFTMSNIEMPLWNANTSGYPQHRRQQVARALAEASQWLQNEGLMMSAPDQPNGYFCLTRKGLKLNKAADIDAAYRADAFKNCGEDSPDVFAWRLCDRSTPIIHRGRDCGKNEFGAIE